jgi:hypothetical protein
MAEFKRWVPKIALNTNQAQVIQSCVTQLFKNPYVKEILTTESKITPRSDEFINFKNLVAENVLDIHTIVKESVKSVDDLNKLISFLSKPILKEHPLYEKTQTIRYKILSSINKYSPEQKIWKPSKGGCIAGCAGDLVIIAVGAVAAVVALCTAWSVLTLVVASVGGVVKSTGDLFFYVAQANKDENKNEILMMQQVFDDNMNSFIQGSASSAWTPWQLLGNALSRAGGKPSKTNRIVALPDGSKRCLYGTKGHYFVKRIVNKKVCFVPVHEKKT